MVLIVMRDREEGNGEDHMTCVKHGTQYKFVGRGRERESVVIEIWAMERGYVHMGKRQKNKPMADVVQYKHGKYQQ